MPHVVQIRRNIAGGLQMRNILVYEAPRVVLGVCGTEENLFAAIGTCCWRIEFWEEDGRFA